MATGRVALYLEWLKTLEIKAFWQRKKVVDFLSKSTTLFGGDGEDRTLDLYGVSTVRSALLTFYLIVSLAALRQPRDVISRGRRVRLFTFSCKTKSRLNSLLFVLVETERIELLTS